MTDTSNKPRRLRIGRRALGLLLAAMALAGAPRAADMPAAPSGLVGTWTLAAVDNVSANGMRTHLYGGHPTGDLRFDAEGGYALQMLSADRPRFMRADKAQGSDAENRAAVMGANSHFGRYEVDPARGVLTFHIDHAFFPNWEGTVQARQYKLMGDTLTYVVPAPTTGGAVRGEVVWKRAS